MKPGDIGLEKRSKKTHFALKAASNPFSSTIYAGTKLSIQVTTSIDVTFRIHQELHLLLELGISWENHNAATSETGVERCRPENPLQNEEQRPPFAEFRTLFPIAILAKRPSAGAWRGYSFEDLYALYIKIPSFTSISDPSCHQLELLNRSEARRHHHIHHDLHQLDVQSTSESLALELKTSGAHGGLRLGALIPPCEVSPKKRIWGKHLRDLRGGTLMAGVQQRNESLHTLKRTNVL